MAHLLSRLARPALALALGLLALRLVVWPVWDGVPPELRLGLAGLVVILLIAALISAGFAPPGERHRNLVAWVSVLATFGVTPVLEHDYRDWQHARTWDLTLAQGSRPRARPPGDGDIVLNRQRDGHYYLTARINDAGVEFLVDTGASVVALGWDDARQVGIRMERLDFIHPVSTAAGQTMAATVIIRELDIGGHRFRDVPAVVLRDSERSLMGMSVLNRFSSLEIREDRLILRP